MSNVVFCICILNIITFEQSGDVDPVFKVIEQLLDRFPETFIEELTQSFEHVLLNLCMTRDEGVHFFFKTSEVVKAQTKLMGKLLARVADLKRTV